MWSLFSSEKWPQLCSLNSLIVIISNLFLFSKIDVCTQVLCHIFLYIFCSFIVVVVDDDVVSSSHDFRVFFIAHNPKYS